MAGKIRGKRDVGTRNAKCAKSVCNYVCNNVRYMYIFADLGQTSGRNQLINLSINFSRYLWPKAKLMRLSRFVRLCWCVSVCNKSAIWHSDWSVHPTWTNQINTPVNCGMHINETLAVTAPTLPAKQHSTTHWTTEPPNQRTTEPPSQRTNSHLESPGSLAAVTFS